MNNENQNSKIHGGDIYRNHVKLDFSVNINPFGVPVAVKQALYETVEICHEYPDISTEKLSREVSDMLGVSRERLLFGNGASELFMAIVHALTPHKTLIISPSFYGYEYAAASVDSEIIYFTTKAENKFRIDESIFSYLTSDIDLLFLANPNNPDGNLIAPDFLEKIISHCEKNGIFVVLDECFIEFCGREYSMIDHISKYDNLIIVRAFTKIFAIPGVRLGYLICNNQELICNIKRQLPEWNVSGLAQAAGCACAGQYEYIERAIEYVRAEREYMIQSLANSEIEVISGEANFILLHSDRDLYEELLQQGILIRDCQNYRGLKKGYYRIAVKTREENDILIKLLAQGK